MQTRRDYSVGPAPKSEHRRREIGQSFLIEERGAGLPTAVVFSAVNANWYGHYNLFADQPCNCIFVRDLNDAWYQEGLEDCANPDEITALLRREIVALGSKHVLTYGSSMGGYAALLFGAQLDAQTILAVSPQTLIDPRLPHTPKKHYPGAYFDLNESAHLASDQHAYLFFGAADLVDAYNALRFKSDRVTRIAVAEEDHLVFAVLTRDGYAQRAIAAAIRGEPYLYSGPSDDRCFEPDVQALVIDTVEAYYLGAEGGAEKPARALSRLHADWAAPWFILARDAFDKRDWANAEHYAENAARLAPRSVTYADYYASVLMKVRKDEAAIAAYKATLEMRPKHYSALCNLAALEARQGRIDQALPLLDAAIEIRPRLTRAQTLRDKLLKDRGELQDDLVQLDKNVL